MKMNVRVDGHRFDVVIDELNTIPVVAIVDGQRIEVWPETISAAAPSTSPDFRPEAESAASESAVYAPIPGVIIAVSVRPGDEVSYGQELCVLEAMKMKQSLRSAREGTIDQVCVTAGQHVGHHELLVTYTD
jgi:biotin carboxyl carrier protein